MCPYPNYRYRLSFISNDAQHAIFVAAHIEYRSIRAEKTHRGVAPFDIVTRTPACFANFGYPRSRPASRILVLLLELG